MYRRGAKFQKFGYWHTLYQLSQEILSFSKKFIEYNLFAIISSTKTIPNIFIIIYAVIEKTVKKYKNFEFLCYL